MLNEWIPYRNKKQLPIPHPLFVELVQMGMPEIETEKAKWLRRHLKRLDVRHQREIDRLERKIEELQQQIDAAN